MPLRPDPFLARFERLRALRRKSWIGYVVAAVAVATATGARLAVGDLVAPFLTFFPAIILAAIAGGLRAGLVAIAGSCLVVDYLFLPPTHAFASTPSEIISLGLFAVIALIQVGLVTLLSHALDRLWRLADNSRFLLEAEPTGLIGVDETGIIQLVNKAVEQQFGYLRSELFGQPLELLLPEDLRHDHAKLRKAFLQSPEARPMGLGRDLQGRRKDGSTVPVEIGLNPIERDGQRGVLATVADITGRKAIERRQQILTNEVRHRGRNLLTVVQAIANRTITDDRTAKQARKVFLDTLTALSRAHDLFLEAKAAPLADLAAAELAPFADRTRVEGCDVMLTQSAAQDFALILHELATNAAKYGALSVATGSVLISAFEVGAEVVFVWEERRGPPVKLPSRKGFGHTILTEVAGGFSTKVVVDYRPEGLRYELRANSGRITNLVDLASRMAPDVG